MSIASRLDMDFAVLEMRIREKDAEIERLRDALCSRCCPGDCRKTIRDCYEAGNCGCIDGPVAYGTKTWPRAPLGQDDRTRRFPGK
jgi:hypothetical protein